MNLIDNTVDYNHLEELSESDYEIVDEQPEIFGWDVIDTHQNKVGEVYELLFNTETLKVRYIVVDMESNDVGLEEGRVIVPIDIAEFDIKNDLVKLPGVSVDNLMALPLYEKGREVDRETDDEINNALGKAEKDAPIRPVSYSANLTKFYDKRKEGLVTEDGNT